jgi:DNA polymerase-3 subunit alpha
LEQRLISDLSKLFLENEGNCPVNFVVYDPIDEIEVAMTSKSFKIDVNNNVIKTLEQLQVSYSFS